MKDEDYQTEEELEETLLKRASYRVIFSSMLISAAITLGIATLYFYYVPVSTRREIFGTSPWLSLFYIGLILFFLEISINALVGMQGGFNLVTLVLCREALAVEKWERERMFDFSYASLGSLFVSFLALLIYFIFDFL